MSGFLSFYTKSSFYLLIIFIFRTSQKITLVRESPGKKLLLSLVKCLGCLGAFSFGTE